MERNRHFVAAGCYLVLALLMWLPYNPQGGFPFENEFAYDSEWATPWWKGFLTPSINMRPFTGVFYHLGYLISAGLDCGEARSDTS
ncbi:MAG: hypothetical protein FJW20_09440 [Acidimicrobiia bacterium]|nr:hypothetical protein [Acidimicrobiia bacterium]